MGKIQLTLVGRQFGDDGEASVTKNHVTADYYERNGSRYILYEEIQEDTGAVIKNALKMKGDGTSLEMTRRGAFSTRMVFEAGREHCADYATPYGCLKLEIATRAVDVAFQDGKMEIRVDYTLSSGGRLLSRCLLDMEALLPEPDLP